MEQVTSQATSRQSQTQHIVLPQTLQQIPRATELPCLRHRWNSNEEIASWLISFDCHEQWLSTSTKTRPQSGSMVLYNRKRVRYRRDGYIWKKRKNERTTRVDHMKLKIQGVECIYGSYVHSALIPTFHRRSYWLLQNPDTVLVHYLNIPSLSEECFKVNNTMTVSSILPASLPTPQSQLDAKGSKGTVWQEEELLQQIKPMFTGTQVQLNGDKLTSESDVANIVVQYLLDLQDQQNQTKEQQSIVFSSLTERASTSSKGSPSAVTSPPSVSTCSIPPSPMSVQSESSSIQPVTDSQPFGHSPNQASTSTNDLNQARHIQETGIITPVPLLLFKLTNDVESAGIQRSVSLSGYPLNHHVNGVPVTSSGGADVKGQMPGKPLTSERSTKGRQKDVSMQYEQQLRDISSRPLITKEESMELRAMVENDPNLKTCRNRFENEPGVHQKVVQLPPYISPSTRPESQYITDPSKPPSTTTNEPSKPPSYDVHLQRQRSNERLVSHSMPGVTNNMPTSDVCTSMSAVANHTPTSVMFTSMPGVANHTPISVFTSDVPCSQPTTNSGTLFQPYNPLNLFTSFQQSLPANVPPNSPPPPYTHASNAVIASTVLKFNATSDNTFQSGASTNHSVMKQLSVTPTSMKQTAGLMHPETVSIPASSGIFRPLTVQQCDNVTSLSGADPTDKNENQLFRPITQPINTTIPSSLQTNEHLQMTVGSVHPSQAQPNISFSSSNTDQVTTAPPSGNEFSIHDLDIELDFDAEMFDSALADITLDNSLQVSTPVPDNQNQRSVADRMTDSQVTNRSDGHSEGLLALQQGTSLPEHCLEAITEFSPDWSYPEGGVKVLVTGPWHSTTASYQCMFDNFGVPASLVQTGVLRCYCPAHEAGVIALQVLSDGVVISKSAIFEYKARSALQRPNRQHEWLSLDENQFHVAILDRLEHIERRVILTNAQSQASKQTSSSGPSDQQLSFEDRVVVLCQRFMKGKWAPGSIQLGVESGSNRGMTLLHLAAALGFSKLISTLVTWRNEQHSLVLEMEVDPLNIDHFSCTPLMWAAALGHKETAMLLFVWSPQALHVCDSLGRLPIDMAKSRGHTTLAECLQHLEFDAPGLFPLFSSQPIDIPKQPDQLPAFMLSSPSTATPSSATGQSPTEFASPYDSPSPSSGCMSQLSVSPVSQGFLSPSTFKAHSPRISVGSQPVFGQSRKPNSALFVVFGDSMDVESASETKGRRSSRGQGTPLLDVQQLLRGIENIQRHDDVGQLSDQEREDLKRHAEELRKLGADMGLNINHTLAQSLGRTPGETLGHNPGYNPAQTNGNNLGQIAAQAREAFQFGHNPFHTQGQTPGQTQGQTESRCDSPMQTDSIPGGSEMAGVAATSSWITEKNQKEQYLNLAEQILNALPARIKDGKLPLSRDQHDDYSTTAPCGSSYGMDISGDQDSHRSVHDESSAGSTYSTDSCLPSPSNLSFEEESSTADWCEFLQGASNSLGMIGAFSLLTLSDEEQMQLYQAALVIQNAFRQYKGRQQQKQQELEAAVIIQNYYRRYKQYIMYSKMSEAAKVIQSRFRSYHHYRQFQRSRRAAIVIQSHYRGYRAQEQFRKSREAAILIQQKFRDKRLARQTLQQDAARKIQRFIRRCQNRLRSLRQTRADVKRFSSKKD